MSLFKIEKTKVKKISPTKIGKEKDIQKLFEENLDEVLNVIFLATEYSTGHGGRIDTLGIDLNGSPVIIEYKRDKNNSVINQGLSYLRWLLDHKANFEILCQKKKVSFEIDWTSPRVICVAESYNKFDLDTAEMLPLKIELLQYKIYQDNLLQLEAEKQRKIRISTSKIYKNTKTENKELQKIYTVDDHLKNTKDDIKKIFLELREKITSLDNNITEEPKKLYIAYKLATNFVDVEIRSKDVKIFLNVRSGTLVDPNNIARDLVSPKKIGHWGNGDYDVRITKLKDIEKVFDLIKQSYDYNK